MPIKGTKYLIIKTSMTITPTIALYHQQLQASICLSIKNQFPQDQYLLILLELRLAAL